MAPPLKIKPETTSKLRSASRQKEDPFTRARNGQHFRSHSRDSLKQPAGRPRRVQNPTSKSASLMNVSKISKGSGNKCYTSDSEMDGRQSKSEMSRNKKMKNSNPSGKLLTKRQMSADHLDSGCATSRRESFNSQVSSHSERSSSVSSEEKLNMNELKMKVRHEIFEGETGKQRKKDQTTKNQIGFGHLPDQVYKKAVRKGFEFSLMVVGESGLGKSTLVNSMFMTDIYAKDESESDLLFDQTLQVETHHTVLEENGVRLDLTVVDTPGFGDAVDNTECWQPIIDYVDKQFEDYLEGETKVERVEVPDTRVHACLYFIAPTGHGLKQLDIQCMKRIHEKVNIIPVIGKADSCTQREVNLFKTKVGLISTTFDCGLIMPFFRFLFNWKEMISKSMISLKVRLNLKTTG